MEIPDAMVDTQTRQMLDDFARRMQSQGLTMEQYFQFTGMTAEKMHGRNETAGSQENPDKTGS